MRKGDTFERHTGEELKEGDLLGGSVRERKQQRRATDNSVNEPGCLEDGSPVDRHRAAGKGSVHPFGPSSDVSNGYGKSCT